MFQALAAVCYAFQFTPPRRGRLGHGSGTGPTIKVSIHAPAQGATYTVLQQQGVVRCFNSRPRAGGDTAGLRPGQVGSGFNSRPRAGGDEEILHKLRRMSEVSIHAPAQGATRSRRRG